MGQRYKQITIEERCEIARLHSEGQSIRKIAAALDRAPSTVARELIRNGSRTGGYKPTYAHQQARARRWSGSKLDRDPPLREIVLSRLNPNPPKGWRYSSGMGDEWQRGAMVRTGLRVDGSGGGLSAVAWRPCAVCGRWQGEMAGRGRSKRHSRTGVARVCGAVG